MLLKSVAAGIGFCLVALVVPAAAVELNRETVDQLLAARVGDRIALNVLPNEVESIVTKPIRLRSDL